MLATELEKGPKRPLPLKTPERFFPLPQPRLADPAWRAEARVEMTWAKGLVGLLLLLGVSVGQARVVGATRAAQVMAQDMESDEVEVRPAETPCRTVLGPVGFCPLITIAPQPCD